MATETPKTPKQIFAVDTNTGQVYIAGNLFVQSANAAGDSWIVGDMISASSVIELADGAIVLDGVNGRITVFDPANLNNGNFIQIEDGFVRQYEAYKLVKKLNTIEQGVCHTETWKTLTGYYLRQPVVYVSPRMINTFMVSALSQDQFLSCSIAQIQKISEGRWKFKAQALITTGEGDFYVTPPPAINGVGAGYWQHASASPYTTTSQTITCAGCNRITVEASFLPVYANSNPNDRNRVYWYGGKLRWRIKYRQAGSSTWNYSSWTDYVEQTVWDDWSERSNSLTLSVTQGTYEVCFEVYTELGSPLKRDTGFTARPPDNADYWFAKSVTLNSSASSELVSGTLAYTAVGE